MPTPPKHIRDEYRQLSREIIEIVCGGKTFSIELDRAATVKLVGAKRRGQKRFTRPVMIPFVAVPTISLNGKRAASTVDKKG